jgi:hypothetical protein
VLPSLHSCSEKQALHTHIHCISCESFNYSYLQTFPGQVVPTSALTASIWKITKCAFHIIQAVSLQIFVPFYILKWPLFPNIGWNNAFLSLGSWSQNCSSFFCLPHILNLLNLHIFLFNTLNFTWYVSLAFTPFSIY